MTRIETTKNDRELAAEVNKAELEMRETANRLAEILLTHPFDPIKKNHSATIPLPGKVTLNVYLADHEERPRHYIDYTQLNPNGTQKTLIEYVLRDVQYYPAEGLSEYDSDIGTPYEFRIKELTDQGPRVGMLVTRNGVSIPYTDKVKLEAYKKVTELFATAISQISTNSPQS